MTYEIRIDMDKLPKLTRDAFIDFDETSKNKIKAKKLFVTLDKPQLFGTQVRLDRIIGHISRVYMKNGKVMGTLELLNLSHEYAGTNLAKEMLKSDCYLSPCGVGKLENDKLEEFETVSFTLKSIDTSD